MFTPFNAPPRNAQIRHPLAGLGAFVETFERRAHAPQNIDDAVARRIAADVADRQIRPRNHRRSNEKKRR